MKPLHQKDHTGALLITFILILIACAVIIALVVTRPPPEPQPKIFTITELNHYMNDELIYMITRSSGEVDDLLDLYNNHNASEGKLTYYFQGNHTDWDWTQFRFFCELYNWNVTNTNAEIVCGEKTINYP